MYIKYKAMEQLDVDGVIPSFMKWKDDDKQSKDPYADYFNLTENDIEKFTPKKKTKTERKKKTTKKNSNRRLN